MLHLLRRVKTCPSIYLIHFFFFFSFLFVLKNIEIGISKTKTYIFLMHSQWRHCCSILWWLECLPMAWETWVQSQVKSYQRLKKTVFDASLLNTSIIKYRSRVKWSNPGKGVAPSPTLWCSSYQRGSLQITLNYGHQLYFYLIIRL